MAKPDPDKTAEHKQTHKTRIDKLRDVAKQIKTDRDKYDKKNP